MLIPRTIPLMEDKLERFSRVARASGVETEFLPGTRPVTVPANSKASLLLDQSYLTTGYPELVTSGGRGANITLTYAEALYKGREKGNRNEVSYQRQAQELAADVTLPDKLSGWFYWKGKKVALHGGQQHVVQ